jgi:outer membrane protein assembly factor BamB
MPSTRLISQAVALLLVSTSLLLAQDASSPMRQWPHWRGPLANGIAPHANPPIHWDATTNIRWKVEIPGEGSATPIVWQDRIFVVAAVPTEREAEEPVEPHADAKTKPPENYYQFVVICLDRANGHEVWRQTATEAVPGEGHHTTNTYASGSPTTDGQRLYVSFGSRGLYCYDLDGKLLWTRDLGQMRTRMGWGEAVTPVVHEDTLIVNWDHEDESFIVALDAVHGNIRWKVDRDEATTWNTPLIVTHEDRTQVIVNGKNRVRSYDLDGGEVIWQCGGQTVNPIPSPVAVDDIVYCVSGYRGAAAYAIPLSARGDITDSETVIWSYHDSTPYVPSPLVYGEQIYFTRSNNGILTSLNRMDGTLVFGPVRLPGIENIYASPAAAAGRIYFVGRDGTTLVLAHGQELEVLSTNRLDDPVDASPVLVDNQLFLRSANHLYCIQD